MINVDNALIALEARINCFDSECEDCKSEYETGNKCPCEYYLDEFSELYKVLYKIKEIKGRKQIDEEDILLLFNENSK